MRKPSRVSETDDVSFDDKHITRSVAQCGQARRTCFPRASAAVHTLLAQLYFLVTRVRVRQFSPLYRAGWLGKDGNGSHMCNNRGTSTSAGARPLRGGTAGALPVIVATLDEPLSVSLPLSFPCAQRNSRNVFTREHGKLSSFQR